MTCPKCGAEAAADAKTCGMCGLVFGAAEASGPQLPAAPSAPTGQQVGRIILPDAVSSKAPSAAPPGRGQDESTIGDIPLPPAPRGRLDQTPTPQNAPAFPPATPDKGAHAPRPTPLPGARAAADKPSGELEFELPQVPKQDSKTFVLLAIVTLGLGGFFFVRTTKKAEPPAPPPQSVPAPVVVKPPPDPLIESCKAGMVGQGFLVVEAEAYCADTPEAWARAGEVQKARIVTIPRVRADQIGDMMIFPAKGETTPKGLVRVYIYLVMNDFQGRAVGVDNGAVDIWIEPQPVGGVRGKPLAPERFRRENLPGRSRPTVHAFLGTADFDPAAVGGAGTMITVRFDNNRIETQAAVSF